MIGGNDAGLSAAGRAKRMKPGLDIRVLEKTPFVGYASCALPNMLAGTVLPAPLAGAPARELSEKRGFQIQTHALVTEINTLKRIITIRDTQSGAETTKGYRKLLLSTGANPIIPPAFAGDANNLFTLRNYSDALAIHNFLNVRRPQTALVVGSGYIGIEVAEALYHRGISVVLVEKAGQLFPQFSRQLGSILETTLVQKGIDLRLGTEVNQCIRMGDEIKSVVSGRQSIPTELIILATGITPANQLAKQAGIPVGESGAIMVNDYLQTRRMDVFAAGDCVETRHLVTGKPAWLPLAGIASRQGRIAGTNLAGKRESFSGALGTFMVRAFGLEFGMTGLSLQDAQKAGLDAVETVIDQNDRPGYMPDASKITLTLITERKSQRVLGGQMIGKADVGLRLNILATAISGKMSARDLEFLDLGYTPLINNMWDPISIAGNAAQKEQE